MITYFMVIHTHIQPSYIAQGTKFHFGVRPSFYISVQPSFSNYVYNHVFLLQSSMFPAYWIPMTNGKSSESVMRVLVIQLRPGL